MKFPSRLHLKFKGQITSNKFVKLLITILVDTEIDGK